MKTSINILIAFILNAAFSVFELFGGVFTGSIAIMSDAVHDMGDAVSIGVSYFLEKKSTQQPDKKYTYGYRRYSVLGSVITTLILITGSIAVIVGAINRMINPTQINYDGMIVFAVVGVCVNLCAAHFTHSGHSLNQKAVNLHMLEDVLFWIVVLVGAVVMRFTDFALIDSVMSIGVAVFILCNAIKNLKSVVDIFLLKTPESISVEKIKEIVLQVEGVIDVHHIHIWTIDGENVYATMHIVTNKESHIIKAKAKEMLMEHFVAHTTIEIEKEGEHCDELNCEIKDNHTHSHHCHHHH